jgi:hypothetical protein
MYKMNGVGVAPTILPLSATQQFAPAGDVYAGMPEHEGSIALKL